MKDTCWDHALEVTAGGNGLVGHGGGILLRKLADQCGLTAGLDAALTQKGSSPQLSRGAVLASTAIAIAMGATAMADIEVLGQLAPVLGAAPSDSTVRRTLILADDRTLAKIAQARARARAHVWEQIEAAGGFPWLEIAGKTLTGWLFLDMDGTLITAYSDKEGAAPTWKRGYGFHPLGCWCANTRECPDMLLRPGNAGSNTFTDHKEVLDRALKQVPAAFRRKVIVRIDGAGASHDLVRHLLGLSSPRKTLLFTCGWMITMRRYDVALCLHDMQGSATGKMAIGPFIYVRFHGWTKSSGRYSDERLDEWADWLSERIADGMDVFVYFNNDVGGHAPRDAIRLRDRIHVRIDTTTAAL